jgi:hypothetical protein
MFDPETQ